MHSFPFIHFKQATGSHQMRRERKDMESWTKDSSSPCKIRGKPKYFAYGHQKTSELSRVFHDPFVDAVPYPFV